MAVTTPHTPPLPLHYLPRPRLDAVWQQAAAHRLILVTAGAGFGKTSFLAEQARKSARPVIWHSLEELDADPATFASRLAGTLRDLDSRSPARAEALAHKAGRLSDSALLASLLRAAIAHDSGIVLLFDDVQHVGQCAEALRFLERLAQALPDSCSMVLSSREPVPMATARLQSLGSVARIGTRDLQFTEEELSSFLLQRFPAAGIQPALVRRLLSETEGWAAGIEILLQASGGSPWAIEEALDRSTQAGAGWFAYFAEEVLGDLDPATREFLRRSSVLPSMEPGLCDRVLGVDDSAARLEALCSRNLFTFPIRRDPPSYRYHHLFREFLKDRLARESDPEEARRLRLRCAEELAAAGAWAEAAMEYAEGGDPRATLAVIERLGEKLLPAGNYRVLRRALESIPDSMLSQHPAALTVLGRMQETHGEWEEARRTYGKAILVARGLAKAELLSLLGQAHIRRGEYGEGERACVEALRQPGRKSAQLRGRVLCLLGVSAGEMGRLAEAERHFDRAIRIFRGIDDASGEGRVLCLLAANVHYYRGDYRRAKEAGRQALVLFQRLGDPHWICHSMMGIAQHAAAAGEPREARDLAERALRLAESLEYRMAEGYCHYTLGICALLARNPAAARMHLGRARQLGEQLGELSLLTWPQLGLAAAHLLEGNRPAAEILAREVLAHTRRGRSPYVEARCYVTLGRARPPSPVAASVAGRWWRRAETIYRRIGSSFGLHEVLLLRLAAGDVAPRREARALAEFLAGIARLDHRFLLTEIEPDRAVVVLARAIAKEIEPDFAAAMLAAIGERAVPAIEEAMEKVEDPVRRRFIETLAQIGGFRAQRILEREGRKDSDAGWAARSAAADLKNAPAVPLRLQVLGPFRILLPSGEVIGPERLRSARATRLLQYLFLQRGRWVPADLILETLWPDADPEKGRNNLRQSVHLLRRALESDAGGTHASPYVRFRNEAYRFDPGEGGESDLEEFERRIATGERWLDQGRRRRAEKTLQEAVDLYRGDLFEESPYEEFLAAAREDARDLYLSALRRLIEIHAGGRGWEKVIPLSRRGLLHDPYSEEIAWHLIHALARSGNRHDALEAYHRYEERLAQDLDLSPSPRMQALAAEAASLKPELRSRSRR